MKDLYLFTSLCCAISNVVYATPSAADAYRDAEGVESGDLIVYLGLFALAWAFSKILNRPIEEVAGFGIRLFIAGLALAACGSLIHGIIEKPYILPLVILWIAVCYYDRKRDQKKQNKDK